MSTAVEGNITRTRVRTPGVFEVSYGPRLEFDRLLVGRSYLLFKTGIKADTTLGYYKRNLSYFCKFVRMDTDHIIWKYSTNVKELQRKLEDYVLNLQERVKKGEIKANTCSSMIFG